MDKFKTILTKLKEIIANGTQKKIKDKDIATVLNIKPTTLASYKSRDKTPYKAILTYCHENRLDVRKILFDGVVSVVSYPEPVEDGKVGVRYFRTLTACAHYLSSLK